MHVEWLSSSICHYPWSAEQLSGHDWWLRGEYSPVNNILTECHIHLMAFKGEGNHCLTPLRKVRASIYLRLSGTTWKYKASLPLKGFFLFQFWVELVLKLMAGRGRSCYGGSGSGSPWTSWISVSICHWPFTSCSNGTKCPSLVGLCAQPKHWHMESTVSAKDFGTSTGRFAFFGK